ncbi:MAG: M48 family metalloprotease, partial [Gemmatimonadaceae bacterium]
VQVTVLLVSLDCLAALLQYEGPIAAAVGAVVLVASNIATSQDLFRWIWRATPLKDDARARRLRALLISAGVKVRRILIIPASIGVAPNAFVSGVLNGRRYLFIAERLLDELPVDEVEAVVAHEIGHLVRRHVARLGIAGVGILAVAAAVLNGIPALASAWGMSDWLRGPLIGLVGAAAPLTAAYVAPVRVRGRRVRGASWRVSSPRGSPKTLTASPRFPSIARNRLRQPRPRDAQHAHGRDVEHGAPIRLQIQLLLHVNGRLSQQIPQMKYIAVRSRGHPPRCVA